MSTLLELAKSAGAGKGFISSDRRRQKLELAIAYMRGEVTTAQVSKAMGVGNGNAYSQLGTTLMSALLRGEIGPIPDFLDGAK